MNEYNFILTDDGSVGLYNNTVQDIYHSRYGALSESIQKFISPTDYYNFCQKHECIKILDICYGIGYNSKTALYFAKLANKNIKVNIDALEIDKDLIFLSPFIKDCIPNKSIDLFLLKSIISQFGLSFEYMLDFLHKMSDDKTFFSKIYQSIIAYYSNKFNKEYANVNQSAFLHNIYYQYISTSMKTGLKNSIYEDCSINYHASDARCSINDLGNSYDFIFLDAFTPQKDPSLWTIDFLFKIKNLMNNNSVLITYSNSTPYRAALLELGFNVGKILSGKNQIGTIASFNPCNIKAEIDSYDIGLTKSAAGIVFSDKNQNLSATEILNNHRIAQTKTKRISTTKYKKQYLLI